MLLVDSSVIVPLFIRTDSSDLAQKLCARDNLWRTEPFALIELSNVLATYERARYLTGQTAREALEEAQQFLKPFLVSVEYHAALETAIRHRVTAYDARFLALADQFGKRLITEDRKLRAAAPNLTQSVADALATR